MYPNKQSTHAHFLILSILTKKIDKDLTLLRFVLKKLPLHSVSVSEAH